MTEQRKAPEGSKPVQPLDAKAQLNLHVLAIQYQDRKKKPEAQAIAYREGQAGLESRLSGKLG